MRNVLIDTNKIEPKECSFGLPWRYDSICFNFNFPDEMITVDDISKIKKDEIETLVVGCDLTDYSFIGEMKNLRQLYIYTGKYITDLDFLKESTSLNQLYITHSNISSLTGLIELVKKQKEKYDAEENLNQRLFIGFDGICIDSSHDLDGKELLEQGMCIQELIINGRHLRKK